MEKKLVHLKIAMPEGVMASLRKDPETFAQELRLVAAVKWYELRMVSQERAAQIAGISRAEFITALGHFGVSPFQYGAEEIIEEGCRD